MRRPTPKPKLTTLPSRTSGTRPGRASSRSWYQLHPTIRRGGLAHLSAPPAPSITPPVVPALTHIRASKKRRHMEGSNSCGSAGRSRWRVWRTHRRGARSSTAGESRYSPPSVRPLTFRSLVAGVLPAEGQGRIGQILQPACNPSETRPSSCGHKPMAPRLGCFRQSMAHRWMQWAEINRRHARPSRHPVQARTTQCLVLPQGRLSFGSDDALDARTSTTTPSLCVCSLCGQHATVNAGCSHGRLSMQVVATADCLCRLTMAQGAGHFVQDGGAAELAKAVLDFINRNPLATQSNPRL
eukprot:SAG11_NODE_6299_length_1342_cov_1.942880_1_plen_298_part_00